MRRTDTARRELLRASEPTALALLVSLFSLAGCSSDSDPNTPEATTHVDTETETDEETEVPGADLEDLADVGPLPSDLACTQNSPIAENPLFKLSTLQYKNTVRDLLLSYELDELLEGVEEKLAVIPADSLGDSFRRLDDRIAIEHVQGFFDVGVFVGDALKADSDLLHQVAGSCASDSPMAQDCWETFKDDFLLRAHRHPLSEAESELYDALREEDDDGPTLIRAAVAVALSSPRFVYQAEVNGEPLPSHDDVLELDAYELASRLSYTFWQTMPDAELFATAQDETLLTEQGYSEQLKRVWLDPRAQETIRQFWNEWLRLEKFTGFETSRPGFLALTEGEHFGEEGHDHYADMVQEVFDLTDLFVFEEQGTLAELLTTNLSVTQSSDLASLYGVSPYSGSGDYPTLSDRSGLLQRGALLVSNLEQTNPFHRGALIRRQILCDVLPQPDPNSLPPGSLDPPPFDPEQTTRERFEAKVEGNGLCVTCHGSFSNIGYVMESYDAVGRFRTQERVFDEASGELLAELPIDTLADADIVSLKEEPVPDAATLNQRIVDSGKVEACLAQSYFQYFTRRALAPSSLDGCVVSDLADTLADEEQGLASAFQRLAQVPTFFTRKVGEP